MKSSAITNPMHIEMLKEVLSDLEPVADTCKAEVIQKLSSLLEKYKIQEEMTPKKKKKYELKTQRLTKQLLFLQGLRGADVVVYAMLNEQAVENINSKEAEHKILAKVVQRDGVTEAVMKFRETHKNWKSEVPSLIQSISLNSRRMKLNKKLKKGLADESVEKEKLLLAIFDGLLRGQEMSDSLATMNGESESVNAETDAKKKKRKRKLGKDDEMVMVNTEGIDRTSKKLAKKVKYGKLSEESFDIHTGLEGELQKAASTASEVMGKENRKKIKTYKKKDLGDTESCALQENFEYDCTYEKKRTIFRPTVVEFSNGEDDIPQALKSESDSEGCDDSFKQDNKFNTRGTRFGRRGSRGGFQGRRGGHGRWCNDKEEKRQSNDRGWRRSFGNKRGRNGFRTPADADKRPQDRNYNWNYGNKTGCNYEPLQRQEKLRFDQSTGPPKSKPENSVLDDLWYSRKKTE